MKILGSLKNYLISYSGINYCCNYAHNILYFTRNGETVDYEPINRLYTKPKFLERGDSKCEDFQLMVILVKSAPSNFKRRSAIRSTWGNPNYLRNISNLIRARKLVTSSNNNRFALPNPKKQHEPNVYFKLVFLVGLVPTKDEEESSKKMFPVDSTGEVEKSQETLRANDKFSNKNAAREKIRKKIEDDIKSESASYKDIVRIETVDTYINNTFKTMMGIRWANEICTDFEYALLVDDDMYISIKNLLIFLESPGTYPDGEPEDPDSELIGKQIVDANRLYAGKVLFTKPIRQRIGKFSIPIPFSGFCQFLI